MEAVVAPVLHRNDVPPDAVSVDEPLVHMDGFELLILQTGGWFTISVVEHELVHPLASVTVYDCVPAACVNVPVPV